MNNCPECGYSNIEANKICENCGFSLIIESEKLCPECKSNVNENDEVCKNCGFPLTEKLALVKTKSFEDSDYKMTAIKRRMIFIPIVMFLISFICCSMSLYVRFNSNYKYYANNADYFSRYADEMYNEYRVNKNTASEYKYGSFFNTNYMYIADTYLVLRDEANDEAKKYKAKMNTMVVEAIVLFAVGIISATGALIALMKLKEGNHVTDKMSGV